MTSKLTTDEREAQLERTLRELRLRQNVDQRTLAERADVDWTYQHQMSVNGKFSGITRQDLLTVADRFGIGTAARVLGEVRDAVSAWPDFANAAGLTKADRERVAGDHRLL